MQRQDRIAYYLDNLSAYRSYFNTRCKCGVIVQSTFLEKKSRNRDVPILFFPFQCRIWYPNLRIGGYRAQIRFQRIQKQFLTHLLCLSSVKYCRVQTFCCLFGSYHSSTPLLQVVVASHFLSTVLERQRKTNFRNVTSVRAWYHFAANK